MKKRAVRFACVVAVLLLMHYGDRHPGQHESIVIWLAAAVGLASGVSCCAGRPSKPKRCEPYDLYISKRPHSLGGTHGSA